MNVKPWATFTSDLPDDHIENEAGAEILQFGGKSVAEAIGEILTGLGCAVSPAIYANEHGWELDVQAGKRQLWCQVTLIEEWVMVFEDASFMASFMASLRGHHPVYIDVLTGLAQALRRDPRFHDVSWFLADEVLSGCVGSKEPVTP